MNKKTHGESAWVHHAFIMAKMTAYLKKDHDYKNKLIKNENH